MPEIMTHIILDYNGDPYGSGFVGMLAAGRHADSGIYMGDIGAQTRAFWRRYAARRGYVLVEVAR